MDFKKIFIKAIHERKLVKIKANTFEKGIIERICVPFDFGPDRSKKIKYQFKSLNSPDGSHNLPLFPEQLLNIEILDENFEPRDHIFWTPNWNIKRDWGEFS